MDNLIDRQAALDAMGKAKWAKERLMELQPAQPDHTADIGKKVSISYGQENGLISRQAAIDALKGLPTWWADEGGYYGGAQPPMVALLDPEDAVSAIENLPSAQPATNCSEIPNSSDGTISRQAALDAIMGQPPEPHYPSWYAAQIEKLPAAQPDHVADIGKKVSISYGQENGLISRQAARHALCKAVHKGEDIPCENQTASCLWTGTRVCDYVREIDALPTVQPEQHWIPVSERLPEESGKYLVTVLDGIGKRTTSAPYHLRSKSWTLTGRMTYWKVIAWMPLPEPYQGGEKE